MTSRERISLPGGDFELLADGPRDAPLALCLHGFPDHPPSFTALLSALAAAGYRAVAPWLRGYAPSTRQGPFDADRLAADVRELVDALSPDRPVVLIGHDWGAMITYDVVARSADRIASAVTMAVPHPAALVAETHGRAAQMRRSWYAALFQIPIVAERAVLRNDLALIDRLWRDWSPGYTHPPEEMRALKRCLAESMPAPIEYYRALFRPLGAAIRRAKVASSQRPIQVPLLLLMGEDDGCIGASMGLGKDDRLFAAPYRRETIPGVGHFMQVENPDEIARRTLAWIRRPGG